MPAPYPLRYAYLFPAVLALALVSGCGPSGDPHGGGFPPPAVTVVTVQPRQIEVATEHVAQTAGYREVEVRARGTGILLKRNHREGAGGQKGDSLCTIDPA